VSRRHYTHMARQTIKKQQINNKPIIRGRVRPSSSPTTATTTTATTVKPVDGDRMRRATIVNGRTRFPLDRRRSAKTRFTILSSQSLLILFYIFTNVFDWPCCIICNDTILYTFIPIPCPNRLSYYIIGVLF